MEGYLDGVRDDLVSQLEQAMRSFELVSFITCIIAMKAPDIVGHTFICPTALINFTTPIKK
jgi:hypothetical protein